MFEGADASSGATAKGPHERPRHLAVKRAALAAATAFLAINLWTGAPLLALWVGSQVVGKTVLSMRAVFVVVAVLAVLVFTIAVGARLAERRLRPADGSRAEPEPAQVASQLQRGGGRRPRGGDHRLPPERAGADHRGRRLCRGRMLPDLVLRLRGLAPPALSGPHPSSVSVSARTRTTSKSEAKGAPCPCRPSAKRRSTCSAPTG